MNFNLKSGETLVFRKARLTDFKGIVEMLGVIDEYGWGLKSGLRTIEFIFKQPNADVFVGFIGKALVCLLALRESFYLERRINLDELAVSAKHQSKGIGSLLIDFTKEYAKKKKISWIEITTTGRIKHIIFTRSMVLLIRLMLQ